MELFKQLYLIFFYIINVFSDISNYSICGIIIICIIIRLTQHIYAILINNIVIGDQIIDVF